MNCDDPLLGGFPDGTNFRCLNLQLAGQMDSDDGCALYLDCIQNNAVVANPDILCDATGQLYTECLASILDAQNLNSACATYRQCLIDAEVAANPAPATQPGAPAPAATPTDVSSAPGPPGADDIEDVCQQRFGSDAQRCQQLMNSGGDVDNDQTCREYVSCTFDAITAAENDPNNLEVLTFSDSNCQDPLLEEIVPLEKCHKEGELNGLFPALASANGVVMYYKAHYDYFQNFVSFTLYEDDTNCSNGAKSQNIAPIEVRDEGCQGMAFGDAASAINVYFRVLWNGLKGCDVFNDCDGCLTAPQCAFDVATETCQQKRCADASCVAGQYPGQNAPSNTCPAPENRLWRSWCDSKQQFGPNTLATCTALSDADRLNNQTCADYLACLDSIADELTIFNDAIFTAYNGSGCADAEKVVSIVTEEFYQFKTCTPMITHDYTRSCEQSPDGLSMICNNQQLDNTQFVPASQGKEIYVTSECVNGEQLKLSAYRTADCDKNGAQPFIDTMVSQDTCTQVTYTTPQPAAANIYFKAKWQGSCMPCATLTDCATCATNPSCGWNYASFACTAVSACGGSTCAIGDVVQCPEPSLLRSFCPQYTEDQYRMCVLENESNVSDVDADPICRNIKDCQLGVEDNLSILIAGQFTVNTSASCDNGRDVVLYESTGEVEMNPSLAALGKCTRVYEAPAEALRTDRDSMNVRYVQAECSGMDLVLTGYEDPNCQANQYAQATLQQVGCNAVTYSPAPGTFQPRQNPASSRPGIVYVNTKWSACNGTPEETEVSILDVVQVAALEILNVDVADFEQNFEAFKAALWRTIGIPPEQELDLTSRAHVHPDCVDPQSCQLKAIFISFNIVGLNWLQEQRFNEKVQQVPFKDALQANLSAQFWSMDSAPMVGDELDIQENPNATPSPGGGPSGGGGAADSMCAQRFGASVVAKCADMAGSAADDADCQDYISCLLDFITASETDPRNMLVYTYSDDQCTDVLLEDVVPLETCHTEFNNEGLFPVDMGQGQVTFKGSYNYSTGGITIAAYNNDDKALCADANKFETVTVTNQDCTSVTVSGKTVYYIVENPGLVSCSSFGTSCQGCITSPKCTFNLGTGQCGTACPIVQADCVQGPSPTNNNQGKGSCPAPEMETWSMWCDNQFTPGVYNRCMRADGANMNSQECTEYIECLDSIADQLTLFNDAIYAAYFDAKCSQKALEVVDRESYPFRQCEAQITYDRTRYCDYADDGLHMVCQTEQVDNSQFVPRHSGTEIYVKTSCNWETSELKLEAFREENCLAKDKFMEAMAVEDIEGTAAVHQASCRAITYTAGMAPAKPARIYFTSKWDNECRPCRALRGCGQCMENPTCSFDTERHRCVKNEQADASKNFPKGQEGGNAAACPEPALSTNFCRDMGQNGTELPKCRRQIDSRQALSSDCVAYKECYLGVEDELSILIAGEFEVYNQSKCNDHAGMSHGMETIGGQDPNNPGVRAPHFPIAIGDSGVSLINTRLAGLGQCQPVFESPLAALRTDDDMMFERYVKAECVGRKLVLKGYEDKDCAVVDGIYSEAELTPALCVDSSGNSDETCSSGFVGRQTCEGLKASSDSKPCVFTASCTKVDMKGTTKDRHPGDVYVRTIWSSCTGVDENDLVTVLDIVKIRNLVVENFSVDDFMEYEPRFKQAFQGAIGIPPNQLLDATADNYVVDGCLDKNREVDRTQDTCTEYAFQLNFNIVGLNFNQEEEMNTWISDRKFKNRLQAEFDHAFFGTGMEPRVGDYINIEENPDATPQAPPGSPNYMAPTPAPTAKGAGFNAIDWASNLGTQAQDFQMFGDRACPGGRTAQGGCLDENNGVVQQWSAQEISDACAFHQTGGRGGVRSCPVANSASQYAPFGKNRYGDILAADGFRARDMRGVPYSYHDGIYQPVDKHDFPAMPKATQAPSTRPKDDTGANTQTDTSGTKPIPAPEGDFDVIWVIVPLICVVLLVVVGYYIYRQRKQSQTKAQGYGSSHFTHLLNEGVSAEDKAL